MKTKIIDLSTLDGFAIAEKTQAKLYEQYDNVEVETVGLTGIKITAY